MQWGKFIEALPGIATQPLAILAYILLVGSWFLWLIKRIQSRTFLKALEALPAGARPTFCQTMGGVPYGDLVALTNPQRVKLITYRYRLVAYISTLIAIILLIGLFVYRGAKAARLEGRLHEIDLTRGKLEEKLKEQQLRGGRTAIDIGGVAEQARHAAQYYPDNPEVIELASRLQGLVTQLNIDFDTTALSQVDVLRLKLAQARADYAKGDFLIGEGRIPPEDKKKLRQSTQLQVNLDIDIHQVSGDIAYALNKWKESLEDYEEVLRYQPHSFLARIRKANCLYLLNRLADALTEDNMLVNEYMNLVQEGHREFEFILAMSLTSRATDYFQEGLLDDAVKDSDKSIEIFTRLVDQENRNDLKMDLIQALWNRRIDFNALGRHDDAIKDADRALQILSLWVTQDRSDKLERLLAKGFVHRGLAFGAHGEVKKAVKDFDRAINTFSKLIGTGCIDCKEDLAVSLVSRIPALLSQHQLSKAMNDVNQAIPILDDLVTNKHRTDRQNLFAVSLYIRATLFSQQCKHSEAIADLEKAIHLYNTLVMAGHNQFKEALTDARTLLRESREKATIP